MIPTLLHLATPVLLALATDPAASATDHAAMMRTAAGDSAGPGGRHVIHMQMPALQYDLAADTVVVPVRIVDGHVFVDVTLDGKGPFTFYFDTGAGGSVMDLGFARAQGLALGEQVRVASPNGAGRDGRMVHVDALRLGGLTLHGLTSIAFDGLPVPRDSSLSVRGVLGPYQLAGLLVTLDYPRHRLVFRRGALPEPDGRDVFGWDRSRHLPEIPVTLAGHPVRVHLDSGSSGGLGLPVAMQGQIPLAGPLTEMGQAHSVDRVDVARGAPLAGRMELGRYTLEGPRVNFVDVYKDVGNVGYAILRQFALTIDPANARLRLDGPADGRLNAPAP